MRKKVGVGLAALAATSLALAGCGGSGGDGGTVTLRLGYVMSDTHPMAVHGMLPFIEKVKENSDGSLEIEAFPDGQLAGAGEEFQAANDGIVDLAFAVAPYSPSDVPLNQAWSLPLGMTPEEGANAMWRVIHEDNELSAEFERAGVLPLAIVPTAAYEFQTTKREVAGIESLKGLRMRAPSDISRDILSAVGSSPVTLTTGEVYEGLDRGTVDGAFYYFGSWKALSLEEQLHYSTDGLEVALGGLQAIVITAEDWNALTEDQQKALYDAGKEVTLSVTKAIVADHDSERDEFTKSGVTVSEWNDADIEELDARMSEVVDKWAESGGSEAEDAIETIRAAIEEVRADGVDELPDYELPRTIED